MSHEPTVASEELDPHSWKVLSDAISRLEQAWRRKPSPDLSEFLISGPEWLRLRVLIELIKVDEECAWQRGIRRMSEEYLSRWPELATCDETWLELLRAECLTRCVFDKTPTADELRTRFPKFAECLKIAEFDGLAANENSFRVNANLETALGTNSETPLAISREQAEAEIDARIGTSMGRYQIQSRLGHGGMGIVYQAWDPHLSREVALKIPRIDPSNAPDIAERFLQEATFAAKIGHRSICPIHDSGVVEGTHYLVMDLVSGHSLDRLLRKGSFPPRRAAQITAKLARALDCIHDAGLMHRDVSASNVIMDLEGEPVLMDFGLAREAGIPVVGSYCSGTPAYMAPEAMTGDPRVLDLRTDVFSLGVLCYQMLTGKLPNNVDESLLAVDGVRGAVPPSTIVRNVDKRIEAICLRAMAPHPAKRYQSAAELADALDEYLKTVPNSNSSRTLRLMTTALVVVGIGVALSWQIWGPSSSDSHSVTEAQRLATPVIEPQMKDFAISEELLAKRRAQLEADLDFIHTQMSAYPPLSVDPTDTQVVEFRRRLISFLRSDLPADLAIEAASRLVKLPWPTVESSDPNAVFWNRMPRIDEPTLPIDSGAGVKYLSISHHGTTSSEIDQRPDTRRKQVHLAPGGTVIVRGRIQPDWEHNSFQLWIDEPGPFEMHIISLTRGFELLLLDRWHEESNSEGTGRKGHQLYHIDGGFLKPENWHTFRVNRAKNVFPESEGDYLLFIWQPTGSKSK